jgi:hypothetical protein
MIAGVQHPRATWLCMTLIAAPLSSALVGCAQTDEGAYIAATLLGDHDQAAEYGGNLLVRAVPDHEDGFSAGRPYLGHHEYADQCPIEHVELPLDFALSGSELMLHNKPARWLLLAWITDDTDATWVAPGELYGTTTFEFWHDPYFGYIAEDVEVELDTVRPE